MKATLTHNVREVFSGTETDIARAAAKTADDVTDGLKTDLRASVTGAGLGTRLANTWRGQRYPKNRASIDAAAFVFSKAPDIIDAFDRGATIVPLNGKKYLAIPTDNVPGRQRGSGYHGTKMNPFDVETAFNQDLKFIKTRKGTLLAVIDAVKARSGSGVRPVTRGRTRQGRAVQQVVMFIMIPAAHMPKKFDIDTIANKWAANVESLLAENLET